MFKISADKRYSVQQLIYISIIYIKLGDVSIQFKQSDWFVISAKWTISSSQEMNNLRIETVAGVNSYFAVVIEEGILQMPTFLECVVLSSSLCTINTITLFNLGE